MSLKDFVNSGNIVWRHYPGIALFFTFDGHLEWKRETGLVRSGRQR